MLLLLYKSAVYLVDFVLILQKIKPFNFWYKNIYNLYYLIYEILKLAVPQFSLIRQLEASARVFLHIPYISIMVGIIQYCVVVVSGCCDKICF